MARRILVPLDMGKNEVQNMRFHTLAGAPATPVEGQPYHNSTDHKTYVWNGSAWTDMTNQGSTYTGAQMVTEINASAGILEDNNLSAAVNDAITKKHAHANIAELNAIEQAFTTALKNKLDGIAANANNYTHPANHPPAIISQDATNRFVTDAEKTTWNAKASAADISAAIAALVDTSPAALDTLNELAAALGDDANFSTTMATALGLKAPLANPTFTGTVAGITKAMVGLGSVDNTADSAKPVSTAQQTALDLKANAANPAFTGTPTGLTKAHVGLGNVDNTSDATKQAAFLDALDNAHIVAGLGYTPPKKYAANVGDNSATSIVVTHNLNSTDVIVQLHTVASTYDVVECDIQITSVNTITLLFATAPTAAQYRVVVIG